MFFFETGPAPSDPTIAKLWMKRRELLNKISPISAAIEALQKCCEHPKEQDVSRHGSPDYVCPECGNNR